MAHHLRQHMQQLVVVVEIPGTASYKILSLVDQVVVVVFPIA